MTKKKIIWSADESTNLTKIISSMNISENCDKGVWDKVAEEMQKVGFMKSSKQCQEK